MSTTEDFAGLSQEERDAYQAESMQRSDESATDWAARAARLAATYARKAGARSSTPAPDPEDPEAE